MLERVLIARVLMTTLSPTRLLRVSVEIPIVLTVALVAVRVLVSIVRFAVNVSTMIVVNEIADTEKVLAVRVLKVPFVPNSVLAVRVDRTVSAFVERVL